MIYICKQAKINKLCERKAIIESTVDFQTEMKNVKVKDKLITLVYEHLITYQDFDKQLHIVMHWKVFTIIVQVKLN